MKTPFLKATGIFLGDTESRGIKNFQNMWRPVHFTKFNFIFNFELNSRKIIFDWAYIQDICMPMPKKKLQGLFCYHFQLLFQLHTRSSLLFQTGSIKLYDCSKFGIGLTEQSSSSENIQQIYRRTPMPQCDFSKVAKQDVR